MSSSAVNAVPAEPFGITLDRPSQEYLLGEKAVFTVTGSGRAKIQFSNDCVKIIQEKECVLKPGRTLKLKAGLPEPGFLRCRVFSADDPKKPAFEAGAAFEPFQLKPDSKEPKDFEAFWSRAIEKQGRIPERLKEKHVRKFSDARFDVYEISMAGFAGESCYGYLGIPRKKKHFPLFASVSWFGGPQECRDTLKRFKGRAAVLILRWQDFPAPATGEKDRCLTARFCQQHGGARHFYLVDIDKPEYPFLLRAILGCRRILKHVSGRPGIDCAHVVYQGSSMPGEFGIFLGGLDSGITAMAVIGLNCGEPAGHFHGKLPTALFRWFPDLDPVIFKYFDGISFAKRIEFPVLMYAAFIDSASLPSHQYPTFNVIHGEKIMFTAPLCGHMGFPPENACMSDGWIRQHLGL